MGQPTIKPDFSHRLAYGNDGTPIERHLIDTIGLMAERASGVLASVIAQLGDDATRVNDRLLLSALYAVEAEIKDIDAVVVAAASQHNQ